MRKRVILITILLVAVAFAGCLGSGEEKKESPELIQKHGTIQQMSGWAESNWASNDNQPFIADIDIGVMLNHTNIIQVKFTMRVEDSDPQHAETDEGSDPDEITITVTGNNVTSDEKKGITPATIAIEIKATAQGGEMSYLGQSWNIHLHAECYGGKPRFVLGFIIYKDQGVAWSLEGEYKYMAEEIS